MFYNIWVDCIKRVSLKESNENKAVKTSLFIISFLMACNFFVIMMVIQNYFGFFYEVNFTFSSDFINYILMIVILYFIPVLIFNLIYINYNLEKIKISVENSGVNGGYILKYTLFSIFGPLIVLWVIWLYYLFF